MFPTSRLLLLICLTLLLVAGGDLAGATVKVTNYAAPGYLVEAQGDHIEASGGFEAGLLTGASVTVAFELLDADGNAVLLAVPGGKAQALELVYTAAATSNSHSVDAQLVPFDRLVAGMPYRVRMRIDSLGVDVLESGPRTYLHFPDMTATAALNALVRLTPGEEANVITRDWLIDGYDGLDGIALNIPYEIHRYNPGALGLALELFWLIQLRDDHGNLVPVNNGVGSAFSFVVGGGAIGAPASVSGSIATVLQPAVQLDSVNRSYEVVVTIGYTHPTGDGPLVYPFASTPQRIAHFNGTVAFGSGDRQVRFTIGEIVDSVLNPVLTFGSGTALASIALPPGGLHWQEVAAYTIGGTIIDVALTPDGTAEYANEALLHSLVIPVNDWKPVGGIPVNHPQGSVQLGINGATSAGMQVRFPAGAGYAATTSVRRLQNTLTTGPVLLNSALTPAGVSVAIAAQGFFCEESKPVWMAFNGVVWDVPNGELNIVVTDVEFTQAAQWDQLDFLLANADLQSRAAAERRSNSLYFRAIQSVDHPLRVTGGADGSAQLNGVFRFGPGSLLPHFPYAVGGFASDPDAHVISFEHGQMELFRDRPQVANSYLGGVGDFALAYNRGCVTQPGASACPTDVEADFAWVFFRPNTIGLLNTRILRFTEDGGLMNDGVVPLLAGDKFPEPLIWGRIGGTPDYAHEHLARISSAAYHMPGHALIGGVSALNDIAPLDGDIVGEAGDAPAVLMFSAPLSYAFGEPQLIERPGIHFLTTPVNYGYLVGSGHYAGLNFRADAGIIQAKAVIGGTPTGNFTLHRGSKYYIRAGGVSGRHQALAFNRALVVYGYDITFTRFGMGFLSNQMRDPWTAGIIDIPAPSDIDFAFEKMLLSCSGDIDDLQIAESQANQWRVLGPNYWRADILPTKYLFAADDPCTDTPRFGVMAQVVSTPTQKQTFIGAIGFEPELPAEFEPNFPGQLLHTANGPARLSGRVVMPQSVELKSKASEAYSLVPAYGAFFNHYADHPDGPGFLVMTGGLDVAFFENMVVTIHAPAKKPVENQVYTYDVMRANFELDPRLTQTLDDPTHRGFPEGVSVAAYRESGSGASGNRSWRARASRSWLGKTSLFNFQFAWDKDNLSFSGEEESTNLVILETMTRVKHLDAAIAEMELGLTYGVPRLTMAAFAINSTKKGVSAVQNLVESSLETAQGKVFAHLDGGLDWLDTNLNNAFDEMLNLILGGRLDALRDQLLGWVDDQYNSMFDPLDNLGGEVENLIRNNLPGAIANNAAGILTSATNATNGIRTLAQPQSIAGLGASLIGTHAPSLAGPAGKVLDPAKIANNPALQSLNSTLDEIDREIQEAQGKLAAAGGSLATAIGNAVDELDLAAKVAEALKPVLIDFIRELPGGQFVYDIAQIDEEKLRKLIIKEIRDAIFTQDDFDAARMWYWGFTNNITMRIYGAWDDWGYAVNDYVKQVANQQLQPIDDKVNEALGPLRDWMGTGSVSGHAKIVGDSLRELKLDAVLEWKVPDELKVKGYIYIRELHSQTDGGDCTPDGATAYEMLAGVKDMKVDWIADSMVVSVEHVMIMEKEGDGLSVAGVGGHLILGKPIKFEGFTVSKLKAGMAISPTYGSYVVGSMAGSFKDWQIGGGFFIGTTCRIEPLLMVNPKVERVVPKAPFTGSYIYGHGTGVLYQLPGVLKITIGAGTGAFYFHETRTFGFQVDGEVHGTILKRLNVSGFADLLGSYEFSNGAKSLAGDLKLTASIWGLEMEFKKSILYRNDAFKVK